MGCILKGGGGLYSRVVVGAVLLAAGAGSRIGWRPKSLLELGGVPLIRRQLIALSGAGVDEVVVVLGHHADHIEPVVQDFPVSVVRNPVPDDGQVSSLRLGLQALSGKLDAVLVALADQPLLNAQDLRDVIGAYKKRPSGTQVVVPTVDGLPGNPVMFAAEVRDAVLSGNARLGCKQWQAAHPEQVYRWDTPNRRYRIDIDSEDDITQVAATTGHQLRWPARWQTEAAQP
ncbi:nucleotidyltransferase family protein [Tepidicella baoligensis]|uniref:nucleotidyltransferase family protein n=1 Tax=Tepidicella baoligensis TaxID=2707016 RepID=UPI0015DB04EC|nr:nucleotidyltransferase family protein [Tepidicella baoligensis]